MKKAILSLCCLSFIGSSLALAQETKPPSLPTIGGEKVIYTRDAHFFYVVTPLPVTFDQEQQTIIKQATDRLRRQLVEINNSNPRTTLKGKLISEATQNGQAFEKSLDESLKFMQQNYGTVNSAGLQYFNALPTAFIGFTGFEVTGGLGLSGGGSIMVAFVFVPMKVKRISIDTGEVYEYLTCDTAIMIWPTANLGAGVGGGGNYRFGAGVVWGQLSDASDLKGLLLGPSFTTNLSFFGVNSKVLLLKNWSKPGAWNNFIWTFGVDFGMGTKAEGHGNLGYFIDAEPFLRN